MPASLRLTDFSDRELLHLLLDAADADGWATAKDIVALPSMKWLRDVHDVPHRPVSARLGWLWRFGVVEREHLWDDNGQPLYVAGDPERPKWGQRWKLTELGEAFALGELTARQQESLGRLEEDPGRLLMTTRWLTEVARAARGGERQLLLREWRFGTAKDKLNGG